MDIVPIGRWHCTEGPWLNSGVDSWSCALKRLARRVGFFFPGLASGTPGTALLLFLLFKNRLSYLTSLLVSAVTGSPNRQAEARSMSSSPSAHAAVGMIRASAV
jgi:hypothetical protein